MLDSCPLAQIIAQSASRLPADTPRSRSGPTGSPVLLLDIVGIQPGHLGHIAQQLPRLLRQPFAPPLAAQTKSEQEALAPVTHGARRACCRPRYPVAATAYELHRLQRGPRQTHRRTPGRGRRDTRLPAHPPDRSRNTVPAARADSGSGHIGDEQAKREPLRLRGALRQRHNAAVQRPALHNRAGRIVGVAAIECDSHFDK